MTAGNQVLISLIGISLASSATAQETIRTRVPKQNIEAFVEKCALTSTRSSCWCAVKNLNATADGQFIIDVTGMRTINPKAGLPELLQVMNRHGMRDSEARTVAKQSATILNEATKGCD